MQIAHLDNLYIISHRKMPSILCVEGRTAAHKVIKTKESSMVKCRTIVPAIPLVTRANTCSPRIETSFHKSPLQLVVT